MTTSLLTQERNAADLLGEAFDAPFAQPAVGDQHAPNPGARSSPASDDYVPRAGMAWDVDSGVP
jgi:hypothetical protein